MLRGDRWGAVAPFLADVGEDVGDLVVFEDIFLGGHIAVVRLSFDGNRSLKAIEDEFNEVVGAPALGAKDVFGIDQWWILPGDALSSGLMAGGTVGGKKASADGNRVNGFGCGSSSDGSPSDLFFFVNVVFEAAGVEEEVAAAPEDDD